MNYSNSGIDMGLVRSGAVQSGGQCLGGTIFNLTHGVLEAHYQELLLSYVM